MPCSKIFDTHPTPFGFQGFGACRFGSILKRPDRCALASTINFSLNQNLVLTQTTQLSNGQSFVPAVYVRRFCVVTYLVTRENSKYGSNLKDTPGMKSGQQFRRLFYNKCQSLGTRVRTKTKAPMEGVLVAGLFYNTWENR